MADKNLNDIWQAISDMNGTLGGLTQEVRGHNKRLDGVDIELKSQSVKLDRIDRKVILLKGWRKRVNWYVMGGLVFVASMFTIIIEKFLEMWMK